MNATRKRSLLQNTGGSNLNAVVNTWSTGGYIEDYSNTTMHVPITADNPDVPNQSIRKNNSSSERRHWLERLQQQVKTKELTRAEQAAMKAQQRAARRKEKAKAKALKEAAKVVVDYRPVMSRIIDDYLFRCPSWHLAQLISERREQRGVIGNVFVYRFSQPTHIPGYKECWGKVSIKNRVKWRASSRATL